MKAVILCGGLGSRISEETVNKPKPLIEIGKMPILWHIMKIYSHYGINDFVICCGYKGYLIKEFFFNYSLHTSNVTINTLTNKVKFHNKKNENWNVTFIDTGENTLTGGRILRIKKYVGENFLLTYGDGVSNVNIKKSIEFHKKNKKIVTMTVVKPRGRFGSVTINNKSKLITNFKEKKINNDTWVNGGFFVLNKRVFDYIEDDFTVFEEKPLENLAKDKQLSAFCHSDFWSPMDTLRDKNYLHGLWKKNKAPWKIWNEK
jgi:glucose-1-phosphate cytidylyltransferase